MGMILKTIVAFALGLGALTAAQHLWMSSITARLHTEMAGLPSLQSQIKPLPKFDTDKLRLTLPTVDPAFIKEGERLGVLTAARQTEMQIRNAQRYVPVPGSIPGMRR
jgi:hypothetical protein